MYITEVRMKLQQVLNLIQNIILTEQLAQLKVVQFQAKMLQKDIMKLY